MRGDGNCPGGGDCAASGHQVAALYHLSGKTGLGGGGIVSQQVLGCRRDPGPLPGLWDSIKLGQNSSLEALCGARHTRSLQALQVLDRSPILRDPHKKVVAQLWGKGQAGPVPDKCFSLLILSNPGKQCLQPKCISASRSLHPSA